jgi:hypothetical protein
MSLNGYNMRKYTNLVAKLQFGCNICNRYNQIQYYVSGTWLQSCKKPKSIKYIILYIIYICMLYLVEFKYLPVQLCNFATTPTGSGFDLQPRMQPTQPQNKTT